MTKRGTISNVYCFFCRIQYRWLNHTWLQCPQCYRTVRGD